MIDTKDGGVHSMDSRLEVCLYCMIWAKPVSTWWKSNSLTDQCTLIVQSLTESSEGENRIDTKVGGVHVTDSRLGSSQVCIYCMIWAKACWVCGESLTLELIDAHSWNNVYGQRWRRGADGHQSWGCEFDGQPTRALPSVPLLYDMG